MGLEKPVNRGLRDKLAPGVRQPDGQLPGRQLRLLQGKSDALPPGLIGDTLPHPAWAAVAMLKSGVAKGQKAIVAAIRGVFAMPSVSKVDPTPRWECSTGRMICSFSDAGYRIARRPHARACFF